ncbi:MAG: fused MFS/spermidine synthase [Dehalococcoidales bacterium]|nr:fused MFS/spermidine synthase [Dehalococcoidales bacterium]
MKMLSLIFGTTAISTSIVLASFMGGMAIGSFLAGWFTDKSKLPLRLYGILEISISAFALLMPILFAGIDDIYIFIHRNLGAGMGAINIIKIALSFIVLIIPTALMGSTLPVISRFFINHFNHFGKNIGRLYFVNTIGGAIGAILAGFVLIIVLGIRESTWLASGINLLIGITAIIADLKLSKPTKAYSLPQQEENQQIIGSTRQAKLALVAFGIAGFCSIALEVLWTRSLIFILDNTAQAFTTMLAAFLTGIAAGSLVMAHFVDKLKRPFLWLGAIIFGIGISGVVSVPVFINLGADAGISLNLFQPEAYWQWASIRFFRSFLVMLIPTLLMGMTFPLVAKIYSTRPKLVGKTVGSIYAINTIGGVAGSLVAGFILIPFLGVYHSTVAITAAYMMLGILLLGCEPGSGFKMQIKTVLPPTCAFILTSILVLTPGNLVFSSQVEKQETDSIIFYDEGIGSTIKVYSNEAGYRYLSIDGFPVASTTPRHRDIQLALGHTPLLLSQKDNADVCIIGLGAGGSSWAATCYNINKLDVIELVPSVAQASRLLPEINHNLFELPIFNLVFADGRNYLHMTEQRYDVISVDATSPKSAGSGNLYSQEFYRDCRQRLTEDGLMVQWLPFHLLSPGEIGITVNTFVSVFPNTSLWFTPLRNYFLLVGSMDRLQIDYEILEQKISQPIIANELRKLNINNAFDFLSCFVMEGNSLKTYAGTKHLNTDNHPRLEYSPSLYYFRTNDCTRENILKVAPLRQTPEPYIINIPGDKTAIIEKLNQRLDETAIKYYWPLFFE